MRYLIIDTEKLQIGEIDEAMAILEKHKVVLSEEETLAIYKELWENGGSCYNTCTDVYAPFNNRLYNELWEGLKKDLL